MSTVLVCAALGVALVADLLFLRWLLRRWDGFHVTITTVKSADWSKRE